MATDFRHDVPPTSGRAKHHVNRTCGLVGRDQYHQGLFPCVAPSTDNVRIGAIDL
jgi:hypothetical protein